MSVGPAAWLAVEERDPERVSRMSTEPFSSSGPAERVLIVSLMKSGTHLIQELMVALGYGMYGQSRITDDIRPELSRPARLRAARLVHGAERAAELENADPDVFDQVTGQAWEALGWAWQARLGLPLENRYGATLVNSELVAQARSRSIGSRFSDTPENVCWILPELDIKKIDGNFIQEWADTGEPRIIFMYRDPRDVILSMVNFLSGKTAAGFGNFSEFKVFSAILNSFPTVDEKLEYALSDPAFPCMGDHRRALWLLHHPRVCAVSFEELVGPRGLGTEQRQDAAIRRILDFVGSRSSPAEVAEKIFREDSFSFFKGQIGAWREVFTARHREIAESVLGDVLSSYGYV
ncbi:sulfotransferase [Saccharopolyspora gregorii]|uniref:sulfotransferase n=1 Tax=Saccharopolyspora gregorii TaxID=33914 RepID=UPI0021AD0115|nr:sulfotransferase [Saccharopolyspora gregorii]